MVKDKHITLRLKTELKTTLNNISVQSDITVSQLIRMILKEYVKQFNEKEGSE